MARAREGPPREDPANRSVEIRCPDGRWISIPIEGQLPWLLERIATKVYQAYRAECGGA